MWGSVLTHKSLDYSEKQNSLSNVKCLGEKFEIPRKQKGNHVIDAANQFIKKKSLLCITSKYFSS